MSTKTIIVHEEGHSQERAQARALGSVIDHPTPLVPMVTQVVPETARVVQEETSS
jgi:hypothetical protein